MTGKTGRHSLYMWKMYGVPFWEICFKNLDIMNSILTKQKSSGRYKK